MDVLQGDFRETQSLSQVRIGKVYFTTGTGLKKEVLTGSGSTYRMRKCKAMDRQMAPTSHGFDQGGIFKRDWFSDRLGSIWNENSEYFPNAAFK